jgi:glycerol uptake facilitator-like aquaporin
MMDTFGLSRRLAAEALGTGILVATVVGAGIMAETLTKDVALALLCNTLPTGAILMVLITGGPQWFAEFVAAFGLVATVLAGIRFQRAAGPWLVGLYITAVYWFTASTSFANPAVAIARSLTNSFSGIRPADLPGFIVAELCGAFVGMLIMNWLLGVRKCAGPSK